MKSDVRCVSVTCLVRSTQISSSKKLPVLNPSWTCLAPCTSEQRVKRGCWINGYHFDCPRRYVSTFFRWLISVDKVLRWKKGIPMEGQWLRPHLRIPAEIHSMKTIHNLGPRYLHRSCQGTWKTFHRTGKDTLEVSFSSPLERTQESRTVNIRRSSVSCTSVIHAQLEDWRGIYSSRLTNDGITVRRKKPGVSPPVIESRASAQSYNALPCVDQKWNGNKTEVNLKYHSRNHSVSAPRFSRAQSLIW